MVKTKSFIKKLSQMCMALMVLMMSVFSTAGLTKVVHAKATLDEDSSTLVANLNNGTNTAISDAELLKLFKALTGDSTLTMENAYDACFLNALGVYRNYNVVFNTFAVRPSLNLNLSEISVSVGLIEDFGNETGSQIAKFNCWLFFVFLIIFLYFI